MDCLSLDKKVFVCSSDAMAVINPEGYYLDQNRVHAELFGHPDEALNGLTPAIYFGDSSFLKIKKNLSEKGIYRSELSGKTASRAEKQIDLSISSIKDDQGKTLCYLMTHRDITECKTTEEHIDPLTHHDLLTGLPNRRLLTDRFSQAIKLAGRKGEKLALLYIDLDHFNRLRDELGHTSGDELLVTIAGRLSGCVRDCDTVIHLPLDIFVILLTETSEIEHAATISQKMLHLIAKPILIETGPVVLSASIGISLFPDDGTDSTTLLDHALVAMSRVKNQGRNGYQFYSEELGPKTLERIELKMAIQRAIEAEEFQVYYQPQIDMESGKIACVEALLRWSHPEKGLLPPSSFIPMAEETRLVVEIDTWVLRAACRQLKIWQDAGFPDLRIAINLSAFQFQQQNLCTLVDEILRETGIAPDALELELTESITMHDIDKGIETMKHLHHLGVRIAIDDFGVGYSSLGYLRQFPIHTLKIDQSFVKGICHNPDDAAITAAIIAMANNLNLEVIAEGVETKDQVIFLREHLCSNMQGFYFSRPLTADRFSHFLATPPQFKLPSSPMNN